MNKNVFRKACVLSMRHISQQSDRWLAQEIQSGAPNLDVWRIGYGYLFYACNTDTLDSVPEDIKQCLQYAYDNGCDFLSLDVDGSFTEDLPQYEWEI